MITELKIYGIINFYITYSWKFTRDMVKSCPQDLMEKYIDYRIKQGDLHTFEIEFLNERQVAEYLNHRVDNGDWVENDEFNKLTEKYKLHYIITHGTHNVNIEVKEWFDLWKKAKGRDYRIEQIFLD